MWKRPMGIFSREKNGKFLVTISFSFSNHVGGAQIWSTTMCIGENLSRVTSLVRSVHIIAHTKDATMSRSRGANEYLAITRGVRTSSRLFHKGLWLQLESYHVVGMRRLQQTRW